MNKIKIKIHFLFYPFGVYFLLAGKIFVFLIYTLTAVLHEIGHSVKAEGCGYRLDKITLMPFGAVVSGETDGISAKDEIGIALAGPFINLAAGITCVALWWVFPETYSFTETIAEANLTMCAVNLIPVLPLDGGRVLRALISLTVKESTATKTCKILGVIFAGILIGLFILTLFFTPNFTVLFFALFVLFGALSRDKENSYVKLYLSVNGKRLKRGAPYKKIGVDGEVTVRQLRKILDYSAICEVAVFVGGEEKATFSQNKINAIIFSARQGDKIKSFISKPS